MKRFFVGGMARMLESIPVERPTDYATPGTGTLTTNKTQVTGINTKFTSEFKKGHSIGLPGWPSPVAEVEQVISDTEMILKRPFDQEFENSVFKWVPKLDQVPFILLFFSFFYLSFSFFFFFKKKKLIRQQCLKKFMIVYLKEDVLEFFLKDFHMTILNYFLLNLELLVFFLFFSFFFFKEK